MACSRVSFTLILWCLYIQTSVFGFGSSVVMLPTRQLGEFEKINDCLFTLRAFLG
jgi:hypothetical protein